MQFSLPTNPCRAIMSLAVFWLLVGPLSATAEDEDIFLDERTLTEKQAALVSSSGTEILTQVAGARAAIAKKDGLQARKNVARARALLGEIRAMSPAVRAEHEINVMIGKIRMDKAGADDLLPIYAEVDAFADAEEVADVRIHVDRARQILESMGPRDREGYEKFNAAADELMEASTKINYLEMDLPVYETYTLLYRAHLALRHNDLKAADASLAEVENHVRGFVAIAARRGTGSP